MKAPSKTQAATEIIDALGDLLGCPSGAIGLRITEPALGYDYSITAPNHTFLAEYKSGSAPGQLAHAIYQLKRAAEIHPGNGIPLMVVAYMSPRGRALCRECGVSWFDLSGNAHINAPGLRIWIEGRANKYLQPGRPSSPFAPRSARVARRLLDEPHRFHTQAELARLTQLGDGHISKIVKKLLAEHYLVANAARAVRPRDPNFLLAAWHDAYDFNRHRILIGQVPASSDEEIVHTTTKQLSQAKIDHAVTGLSAAWLWTKFASYRRTTIFVRTMPSRALLKKIRLVEQPHGGNLWFVTPSDDFALQGSQQRAGIQCASALQIFLDLKSETESTDELALKWRKRFLTWRKDKH